MRKIFGLVLCLFMAAGLLAQDGPVVNPSSGPPGGGPWHSLYFYDASSNLTYTCWALPRSTTVTWLSATTLTSVVDSSDTATVTTTTAHGLTIGATVALSGFTGDTDLNATYEVLTVPTTATFTITTALVTDGTYNLAGGEKVGVLSTTALQDTGAYWSIQRYVYDTSNRIIKTAWADGTKAPIKACASRASYSYR